MTTKINIGNNVQSEAPDKGSVQIDIPSSAKGHVGNLKLPIYDILANLISIEPDSGSGLFEENRAELITRAVVPAFHFTVQFFIDQACSTSINTDIMPSRDDMFYWLVHNLEDRLMAVALSLNMVRDNKIGIKSIYELRNLVEQASAEIAFQNSNLVSICVELGQKEWARMKDKPDVQQPIIKQQGLVCSSETCFAFFCLAVVIIGVGLLIWRFT